MTSSTFTMADLHAAIDRIKAIPKAPPAIRIVSSSAMVEQFRFARSKGKRIRKKWRKNLRNWRPSRRGLLDRVNNVLFAHPAVADELRREMKEKYDRHNLPFGFYGFW